jgi:hypothetical protein
MQVGEDNAGEPKRNWELFRHVANAFGKFMIFRLLLF